MAIQAEDVATWSEITNMNTCVLAHTNACACVYESAAAQGHTPVQALACIQGHLYESAQQKGTSEHDYTQSYAFAPPTIA